MSVRSGVVLNKINKIIYVDQFFRESEPKLCNIHYLSLFNQVIFSKLIKYIV
jgi:hypothetical protein